MQHVIIIGTGGHAKVVADIIKTSGDIIYGFLDDIKPVGTFLGYPVLGKTSEYTKYMRYKFIIAIGDSHARENISTMMKDVSWYTAIHPSAIISSIETSVGIGSVICANSVINPCASIGKHSIINTNATIEHDISVGDFSHISVGSKLAGHVSIGTHTWIGIGATIKNNITVCDNCMIGAGAVVVSNITTSGTYIGVPAIRKI